MFARKALDEKTEFTVILEGVGSAETMFLKAIDGIAVKRKKMVWEPLPSLL